MTEIERRVVEILVAHPVSPDPWHTPIHAVDAAMGWHTLKSKQFVEDLIERGLVHWEAIATEGMAFEAKSCWKPGKLDAA